MTIEPSAVNEDDLALMKQVLDLAKQGEASVHPNPMVGCIIVNNGEIVGQGCHQKAGESHAERIALEQAGDKARGAIAYVSLEPCCHQGRTPPCTDALLNAGITKVVAAMADPNPLVAGGGFELLKVAGIEVVSGVLEQQARWLNRGFVSRMAGAKPWVVLKSAATLDGRTAAFDGESKWITSDAARHQVQLLRSKCSAIITGIGTVLADDPSMTVRLDDTGRQPLRVVLDSQLRMPLDAKIIGNDDNLVIFTNSNDESKVSALIELGAEVVQFENEHAAQTESLDLQKVLDELVKWQCNTVLIEAGQTLSGAFLQQDLVDELVMYYAGSIMGSKGKGMFEFDKPLAFNERIQYRINDVEKVGTDVVDVRISAIKDSSVRRLNEAS